MDQVKWWRQWRRRRRLNGVYDGLTSHEIYNFSILKTISRAHSSIVRSSSSPSAVLFWAFHSIGLSVTFCSIFVFSSHLLLLCNPIGFGCGCGGLLWKQNNWMDAYTHAQTKRGKRKEKRDKHIWLLLSFIFSFQLVHHRRPHQNHPHKRCWAMWAPTKSTTQNKINILIRRTWHMCWS